MISEVYSIFSPSGSEKKMREYLSDRLLNKFDEVRVDNLGNLIAKSGSPEFCIECSMDSCGIMLISIEQDKVHFAGVGGINAEYLIGKKILFNDGGVGIVRYDGTTPKDSKISDLYLECDTAKRSIGDFGVVKSGYCETNDKIFANGLGNKLGLAAVLEAIDKWEKIDNICVLFSVQKRLGARGIQTFFGINEFDRVVTVDAVDGEKIKAPVFVIADQGGVCDTGFKAYLKKYTDNFGIVDENLCIGNVSASGKGASCAALGIPVAHKNKNFESVKKTDLSKAVELLTLIIEDLQNKG